MNAAPRLRLDLPLAAGVVLAVSVARLLVGGLSGLSYDEAYYAFWSTHPAAGYLDHPPMVAWMMTIGRAVFGNTEFGVRAMTVLALALTSAAIFRTTAILADRRAAALAVILFNFAPGIALGFVATPDAPSMLFWAAALWAVAEFIGSQGASWWLAAGLFAGLGLTSKYTDAFLPLGLFLFIIVSRERRVWLRLWQVWAGVALALAVFSPVLVWNAQRQWVSFRFQGSRTIVDGIGSAAARHIFELVSGFVVTLGPVLAAAAFAGL
ncbi:MAG: glycosyltransferase family 39 protein, partial [Devosia sp.]